METTYKFEVGLRFEPFYALNVLLNPSSRVHPAWREATLTRLPRSFHAAVRAVGGASEIWATLPSVLPKDAVTTSFDETMAALRGVPASVFAERLLAGVLHAPAVVASLLSGKSDLRTAIGKIPRAKREWLGFVGLYPYDPSAPMGVALEALLGDADALQAALLDLLETFWRNAFAATWAELRPQMQRSVEEKERLFASCGLAEFFERSLIRARVDEAKGIVGAVRGGYELRLANAACVSFMPSAFNDRRYWSAIGEHEPPLVAYFPYFDPALSPLPSAAGAAIELAHPELDVAMIFKALGDGTRFAIATMLAASPRSSVELARALAVSKPTISHHVALLRQAGLLEETSQGGSVRLGLQRGVLESLSSLAISQLYPAASSSKRDHV